MELIPFEGPETDESRIALLNEHLPEFKKELEAVLKGHVLKFAYRLDLQADYVFPVRAIAVLNRDGYHPIDIHITKDWSYGWQATVGSMARTDEAYLNNLNDLTMLCDQVEVPIALPPEVDNPIAKVAEQPDKVDNLTAPIPASVVDPGLKKPERPKPNA
jgi:hypothetical protein